MVGRQPETPSSGEAEGQAPSPRGVEVVRAQVPLLPNTPGVYRMLGERGDILYVGKARSLRKRVAAYTRPERLPARIRRMVALTRGMEFVTTESEVEALLLEANLIKRHRPPFNILLRDDKSFPYIFLRSDHPFPMIGKHRGARARGCEYWGPFASAGAVSETLTTLLKAFPLRSCNDSMFENRTRPCLQYQIKRCSGPCVGRISKEAYAELVRQVREVLNGRSHRVQEQLSRQMHEAADRLDFEQAAVLRDRLAALAHIQSRQNINVRAALDADVVALARNGGQVCIQVFFYREGRNYGNRAYYPAHVHDAEAAEVMAAFLTQFYAERRPAGLVLVSDLPPEAELVARALSERAGRRVRLVLAGRGERRRLVEIARTNAERALARRLAERSRQRDLLVRLAERFALPAVPSRIEIYDNSHLQGKDPVGAFVVFGPEGFERRAYRTFSLREAGDRGDDYAMLREMLRRRFSRLLREDPDREREAWPDLLLIDGGAGQVSVAARTLEELGIRDMPVIGVAKGPDRDAGREHFHRPGVPPVELDSRDPVLYLLQRLRDEAHRFVIRAHRNRRRRGMGRSVLDQVPGIGPVRKRALLGYFGSARGVEQASLRDLERVPGISRAVARNIYDHLHDSD